MHYAWLTTDTSCLDQPNADVVVLRDEADVKPGELNSPLLTVTTTVPAADGNHADAIAQAADLLDGHGWEIAGQWEAITTGYLAPVTRA